MIHQGSMASFSAKTFEETWVTHVLVFEYLYGNSAADDVIRRLPHFSHSANRNPVIELVPTSER
jgi:hypothetical protein